MIGEGEYAATLHFAEKFWGLENPGGGGEGTRVFDVFCNGVALLRELDVQKEGGGSRPLVRTLKLIFGRGDAFSPKIHFG